MEEFLHMTQDVNLLIERITSRMSSVPYENLDEISEVDLSHLSAEYGDNFFNGALIKFVDIKGRNGFRLADSQQERDESIVKFQRVAEIAEPHKTAVELNDSITKINRTKDVKYRIDENGYTTVSDCDGNIIITYKAE